MKGCEFMETKTTIKGAKECTAKGLFILNLLSIYEKGTHAKGLIQDNVEELKTQKIDTTRINSVNATLAYLATKGWTSKERKLIGEKVLTSYTINKSGIDLLASIEKE